MLAPVAKTFVILVVEDDRQAREMFRTALRNEGYNVVAVGDGLDALTYLETHSPAAVVLDLGLPRLHGRDVLAEMAAQGLTQAVPVIVVTGESRPLLNDLDYACVLRKPISPEELITSVRGCIAKARIRAEG
ncbi:MAG TPA: response regulator [Vicinamibacterales bacterium]|nr:response regulator [Vicinamibacterales bacterium]